MLLQTSEIEGERLDPRQMRSSIAPKLGVDVEALKRADRRVEGVVRVKPAAVLQHVGADPAGGRLLRY